MEKPNTAWYCLQVLEQEFPERQGTTPNELIAKLQHARQVEAEARGRVQALVLELEGHAYVA